MLHLVELLDELLQLSGIDLLEGLLQRLSLGLLGDVELSFQELLQLVEPLGLVI